MGKTLGRRGGIAEKIAKAETGFTRKLKGTRRRKMNELRAVGAVPLGLPGCRGGDGRGRRRAAEGLPDYKITHK
jgi:hypothetical protein